MIRFINLTGQILIDDPEVYFAWFDTIVSRFMEFNDSQYWNTWKEFEQDLTLHYRKYYAGRGIPEITTRFRNLYPPTVLFMEGYIEPGTFKTSQTNQDPSSKE